MDSFYFKRNSEIEETLGDFVEIKTCKNQIVTEVTSQTLAEDKRKISRDFTVRKNLVRVFI